MPDDFTHLWVHSHYSLLGGTASPADLARQAAADGLTHLTLTDRNGLYGAVAFDRACQAACIQPIVGMTVNVAPPARETVAHPEIPGRLVLLATGPEGYRSLCRLTAVLQGSPEREKRLAQGLDWAALKAHSDGLICLSGGRLGWLERYLRAGNPAAASRCAARLGGIYGERAFLSLEIHVPEDVAIAQETAAIAARFGLGTAVAQPIYTLAAAERPRLTLQAAIDHNSRLADVPTAALPAWGDSAADLHWLSPAQMAERYAAFPDALAAAGRIAAQCQPALLDGRRLWPVLDLPPGQTAETAYVRGGAVIVDHGWGIYTGYYHMSDVAAEAGQWVDAGQHIGGVGTTGLSTGNHLHWDLLVGSVWVDGLAWLEQDMGGWLWMEQK